MKLRPTQKLFEYWTGLRNGVDAPFRCQIDPAAMRAYLPEVFVLSRNSARNYPFRIAGTGLCSYFGAELRDVDFLDLWSAEEREGLESLLLTVTEDCSGAVLGLSGWTADDRRADFEAILLPLRHDGEACSQVIGTISPFRHEFWLGHKPIVRQSIQSLRLLWTETGASGLQVPERRRPREPIPITSARPTRPQRAGRAHLVVIEGGRAG